MNLQTLANNGGGESTGAGSRTRKSGFSCTFSYGCVAVGGCGRIEEHVWLGSYHCCFVEILI